MNLYPKPLAFFLLTFILCSLIPAYTSLPFVVFHGLGESCFSQKNQAFIKHLSEKSNSPGYCIEIGNGEWTSWTRAIPLQVPEACMKLSNMPELENGYNIVGLSQGNMIARGVIEMCDFRHRIKKFIGIGGPHAGIASVPYCGSPFVCDLIGRLLPLGVYNTIVQTFLAPANYIRIPTDIRGYLRSCEYLPIINNELGDIFNGDYKINFAVLEKLVLVKFEDDEVLVPRETSWFGFYEDNNHRPANKLIPYNETDVYLGNYFGLRTLDQNGKIVFLSAPGDHQNFTPELEDQLAPYLA